MNRQQWTLLSGIGLGAGLMYLLDPAGGRERRTLVRNKGTQAWSTGSDAVRKTSRHVGNRAKGLAADVSSRLRPEDVQDEVIVARVRSKMGRYVSQPSLIGVVAEDGRVTLTGPVSASEVGPLLGAVRAVRGVKEIDDRLEVQEGGETGDFAGFDGDGASRWSRLRDSRVVSGLSGLKHRRTLGAALGTVALGVLARNLARRRNGSCNGEMVQVEVIEVVTVEEEVPITSFDNRGGEVPSSFL